MKKIGKFNHIAENVCKGKCECGWNLQIGGENKEDLEMIKAILKALK